MHYLWIVMILIAVFLGLGILSHVNAQHHPSQRTSRNNGEWFFNLFGTTQNHRGSYGKKTKGRR